MRLPMIIAALTIAAPAASEAPQRPDRTPDAAGATSAVVRSAPLEIDKCRATRAHHADTLSAWRGKPVQPKKLDELPPAEAYMAVYRTINGCEEPMTVVEYRTGSSR